MATNHGSFFGGERTCLAKFSIITWHGLPEARPWLAHAGSHMAATQQGESGQHSDAMEASRLNNAHTQLHVLVFDRAIHNKQRHMTV